MSSLRKSGRRRHHRACSQSWRLKSRSARQQHWIFLWQQRNMQAAMICEEWGRERSRVMEIVGQIRTKKEGPPRIASDSCGQCSNVAESLLALRDEAEHAEPAGTFLLERLVQSQLLDPAVSLRGRCQRLGRVIQLH